MATQRIDRTTQLIDKSAATFMRPLTISFRATNLKPNTTLHAFFDGVNVDRFVTPSGGVLGGALITNSSGTVNGTFTIPGKTFTVGTKKFVLQQSSEYVVIDTLGNTDVYAVANFSATGITERYQTTVSNVSSTTIEQNVRIEVPYPVFVAPDGGGDPLAQSFFTYGVQGGCFITSLDLYFATKDTATNMPVWVEVREMENGYPSKKFVAPNAVLSLPAANVNTSSTGAVATKFQFSSPIYLKQDSDYCFVVRSNSDKYSLWTSRMGEVAKETGKVVFDQPYSGSLFKSENNMTWTAEQNEDIKFTLNKAVFVDPQTAPVLNIAMAASPVAINCNTISTTTGSSVIRAKLPFKHSLDGNSRVQIACDPSATYNGITGSLIHNVVLTVNSVIDDYTVDLNVIGASATSTGSIVTGGRVVDIQVKDGGSGYAVAPTLIVSPPSSGVQATVTAVVSGGKIVDVIVTNHGSGYTSAPAVTVSGSATFYVLTDEKFTISTNRLYHRFNPSVSVLTPPGTNVNAYLSTTKTDYSPGKTYSVDLKKDNQIDDDLMLVSRANETTLLAGSAATALEVTFADTAAQHNPNVSPVIDFNHSRGLFIANYINNSTDVGSTELTSDTSATVKKAESRYVTKQETLSQTSKGARIIATAYSNSSSGFDIYLRTSNSSTGTIHNTFAWQKMNCDVTRNRSTKKGEFKEYEFYLDDISEFDTFTIKFVLTSDTQYDPPIISDYRAIMLS